MDYQKTLTQLYQDFNDRNIDTVLLLLHDNVIWPNGWEGGFVQGHSEVRKYWLRQWSEIDPKVVPISFEERPGEEISVGVHQIIKDLTGQILSDSQVKHVYNFDDGKVSKMIIE